MAGKRHAYMRQNFLSRKSENLIVQRVRYKCPCTPGPSLRDTIDQGLICNGSASLKHTGSHGPVSRVYIKCVSSLHQDNTEETKSKKVAFRIVTESSAGLLQSQKSLPELKV